MPLPRGGNCPCRRTPVRCRATLEPLTPRAAARDADKAECIYCRHMLDFGANPIERQLLLSAQFLRAELPIRLAHRVAELENLPYGLSAKPHVLKVGALTETLCQKNHLTADACFGGIQICSTFANDCRRSLPQRTSIHCGCMRWRPHAHPAICICIRYGKKTAMHRCGTGMWTPSRSCGSSQRSGIRTPS